MSFLVLHPIAPAVERRYDGPAPSYRRCSWGPSGLLDRLAAEARTQVARRRQLVRAVAVMDDALLCHCARALTGYRRQALTGIRR